MTLTILQKRQKLIEWVKRKNSEAEPRKKDWQELWIEIEPYFLQCNGDNELKLKLMLNAYNYR